MTLWPLIYVKCRMDPRVPAGTHPFSPFNPGDDWAINMLLHEKQRWHLRGYSREESHWSSPSLSFSLPSIPCMLIGAYRGRLYGWAAEHSQCCFIPVLTPDLVPSPASLALPGLCFSRCWTKVAVRLICPPGLQWGMLSMCRMRRR